MTYVVTQNCCNDASCIDVCPVDCIRPAPTDVAFGLAEMVYIDPDTCIDCGACKDACPVDAVYADDELPSHLLPYIDLNARYFEMFPLDAADFGADERPRSSGELPPLDVAVVGSGPAGTYAAQALLEAAPKGRVAVTMIDRLPTPWGLIRGGVAPDHQSTKKVTEVFEEIARHPHFEFVLNTEVGRDVSHREVADRHDAVVYAIGAQEDRRLGIPGEDITGVTGAAAFVSWYNGHPDFADLDVDLSGERAVVVGNGNVALDVARVLLSDPESLATTDIADHALEALRASNVHEVVVLGRRGPAEAAFSSSELLGLSHLDELEIVVEPDGVLDMVDQLAIDAPFGLLHKTELMRALSPKAGATRRLVLRFLASPSEFVGSERVSGLRVALNQRVAAMDGASFRPTGESELIEASLVVTSVGYGGAAIEGLPFDDVSGVIPTDQGRVIDPESGDPVPGAYATGWIKRGPVGGIGANGRCARETVANLLDDAREGRLPARPAVQDTLLQHLRDAGSEPTTGVGWARIDQHERDRGAADGRSRLKLTRRHDLLARALADGDD